MLFRKVTTVSTYGALYPEGVTLFECSDCPSTVTSVPQSEHSAFHLSLLGITPENSRDLNSDPR